MHLITKRSTGALVVSALGFLLAVGFSQQPVAAQGADAKMEQAFKNIKSLNGLPAEQLLPTMVMFEAALGVGCPYCHDNDAAKRELDSKPQKLIARQMIEMVSAVNKSTFAGNKKVSCFTCHSGRNFPIGTPNVTNEELPPALGEDYVAAMPPAAPVPATSAAQVLDKFAAALGGAALQRTPSLVGTGTVTQRRPGRDFPAQQIEISAKAPGMQVIATRVGQADNLLAYSGASNGWARAGNTPARDLRKAEYDSTRLEDAFNLPAQLKQMLLEPKMEHPEVFKGREVYVVSGKTQNLPMVKAYFEKDSGMLARLVYFVDTPFGPYPTQIEYGDFRDVGGRKVPFKWVISQTRNREFTWAMQDVKAAPVEDAKFARPAKSTQ